MRLPSEYYIRYLIYVGKSSDEILASLRDKLLIRNVTKNDIDNRVVRFWDLVGAHSSGKTVDDILKDAGIFELVDHHVNARINPDVYRAYSILAFTPVRRLMEQLLILRVPCADIVARLRDEVGYETTEEAVRLYGHFFCLPELSQLDWFLFLRQNDTFGHFVLFENVQTAAIHRDRILNKQKEQAEFEFIARNAFAKLQSELVTDEANPDLCSKWYKIFESSRAKTNPGSSGAGAGQDGKPEFEVGFQDMPETKLRTAEEFVTVMVQKPEGTE